ncbi:hypothetical protein CVT24_005649 [Panaeolus cyanescens]|uniref:Vacuolar membrane-associated protein IML1 n=1 Tax=Panaeolus cyanescens TaxID=181874 RepID=A0A409V9I8_9AGAR|nr:hypothetical protein CVT24_005649 [Panaeolus cyanescens]
MATSREQSRYGRRRSDTTTSNFRVLPTYIPLKIGDTKVLNAWVHDQKDQPSVIFNQTWWPGVAEGDLLRVSSSAAQDPDEQSFLFLVPKDEGCYKPQLQISVSRSVADVFGLRNNSEVTLAKVDKDSWTADYVEFTFQDQYLGRNEMWRLGKHLAGQCVYKDQEVSFIGGIAAKISNVYIGGKNVSAAIMTTSTKAIYRSLSAKITIFIQVCTELWEFAGDGERYTEKIVHSFLPSLFEKWKEAGTNHTVTIVLVSRVFYDDTEIGYAAGPLRRDEHGRWYKDFYKVITDLEVIHQWKPTLINLKNSFWDFQRDILLTHHYHQAMKDSTLGRPAQVRLVGKLSYAQDGPILEALNLALNPSETHYIDRSLNLTGAATIIISPGTGHFQVSKQLLRLTTKRMLDQGFLVDLVLLTKAPLYSSPIFSFLGTDPAVKPDKDEHGEKKNDVLMLDPLWGGNDYDTTVEPKDLMTFWWEPFWVSTTFWDKQLDLPFRPDRFIARAKMHEIQMMGLLEHDVLSSIEVPYLNDKADQSMATMDVGDEVGMSQAEAEQFDMNTFALTTNYNPASVPFSSALALPRGHEKRASHRQSTISTRFGPIEESPRMAYGVPHPPTWAPTRQAWDSMDTSSSTTAHAPGTSPSQSSIRSATSETVTSTKDKDKTPNKAASISKGSLASKLTPSWLFNPFKSVANEPSPPVQESKDKPKDKDRTHPAPPSPLRTPLRMVSAAKPMVASSTPPAPGQIIQPDRRDPLSYEESGLLMQSSAYKGAPSSVKVAEPVAIKSRVVHRSSFSNVSRTFEESETVMPHRYIRRSPINTPPQDGILSGKRRSATSTLVQSLPSSSSYGAMTNPTRPQGSVPYPQTAFATRWKHIYPQPVFKHEWKWRSMVTPVCLPLTLEYLSSVEESFVFDAEYSWVIDPSEQSIIVRQPPKKASVEETRRAFALGIMRGMVAVRLAHGFQFIVRPENLKNDKSRESERLPFRRGKSYREDDDVESMPIGPAAVLTTSLDTIWMSTTNEVHKIWYSGEMIHFKKYSRKTNIMRSFDYKCLIWPKLGGGYTEVKTAFSSVNNENQLSWNRLDMLVSGVEQTFADVMRPWRTRFIVIPTTDPPEITVGPSGEQLNHEEARLLGMEKLAEQFNKLRWLDPKQPVPGPVRFLPTTLDPTMSVLDEGLMEQLDQFHAQGPMRKKPNATRDIATMSLMEIAKAMREDDGVPIKLYKWHRRQYPDSFIGYDFVSWLVREFRDVSTRSQGLEWGVKLQEQGLFEHCRGTHKFLDGHYYYRLKGEYSVHSTPKYWFRRWPEEGARTPSVNHGRVVAKPLTSRKRSVSLSHSFAVDIDPQKKSDQGETVVLHHDIIHNPATVFHFELNWVGTTARCIEDLMRVWSRNIERYGLKLVEGYVDQICDIRNRNAFQSCFPMPLALPPPNIPNLDKRVPEGTQVVRYFEYALLHKFGFIVDIEAGSLYPETVDVAYTYRHMAYDYSQFVHRSGVAFVQVLGGSDGFLFLTNRLMGIGRALKFKDKLPAQVAEQLRVEMADFCSDAQRLKQFYDEEAAKLGAAPPTIEEPPPLAI